VRRLWGCDFDTHALHLAWLPLDPREQTGQPRQLDAIGWKTWRYRHTNEDAFHAIAALANVMLTVPFGSGDLLYIEHGYGANRSSDWSLGRVQGAIVACASLRVTVEEVQLSTWRKTIYGRAEGIAKAEADALVATALEAKVGLVPDTADLRAALAIAYAGRELNEYIVGKALA
jgi:hypothetical protein